MAFSTMIPLLLVGTLASSVFAQQFTIDMPLHTITYEGQSSPLVLTITRTGTATDQANVTLEAYELNFNSTLEWQIPVTFFIGESVREIRLGVLEDLFDDPDGIYLFRIINPTGAYTVVAGPGGQDYVVVSYIDNDGPPLFDCTAGDVCSRGVCDLTGTRCLCPEGYGYSDCSLNLLDVDVPPTVCGPVTCGIGGVCVAEPTGPRCACQPGYGGPDCSLQQRYDVMCYQNGMCLNVNPPSGYVGSRYIRGLSGVSACTLQDVTSQAKLDYGLPDHWEGSFICLPNTGSGCGDIFIEEWQDSLRSYSRQVHIRLTNEFILHHDILFTGRCIYDSSGVLYINQIINPGPGLIQVSANDTISPVSVKMVNRFTRDEINQAVFGVGEEICFAFQLEDGFSSLRINNIIADDGLPNPETHEVIRNGCPVAGTPNVVSELPYLPDDPLRDLTFFCLYAFAFDTSDQLGLTFETTVCEQSDTLCTPYSCDGEISYGRKKRDVQISTDILKTTITIKRPEPISQPITGPAETEITECALSQAVIAALAVLAVVTLILLFAVILLVIRATRSRKHNN